MLGGSDAESSASELKAKRQVKGRGGARGTKTKIPRSSLDLLGAAFDQAMGEDVLSGDEASRAKRKAEKKEKKTTRKLERLEKMMAEGLGDPMAAEPTGGSTAGLPEDVSPGKKLSLREVVAARRDKKRKASVELEGEGDGVKRLERFEEEGDAARKTMRHKGPLDLGSDESLDAEQIQEWETKMSESKDKGSDDLKTAFFYSLTIPVATPTSLLTDDGKIDMDAVLARYFRMSFPQRGSAEDREEESQFSNEDAAYLLWLIRKAKALQLTTDAELVKGRAVLGRRKPRKGAPLDLGKEENAAWEEDLSTRQDLACEDHRTAFSIKLMPLPKHEQSFNSLDGDGKFNLHFLLPHIRKFIQAMSKDKKSPDEAQGNDRQLLWIARRARDLKVTNDAEMKKGRISAKRFEAARKSGNFTLRGGQNPPLAAEREEAEDGVEQARFEFPTLAVAETAQEDRKGVISSVRSQVAERQSVIRVTSSTTLDMEKMESLLTAPQLSFDAPEVKDDDDDEDSGLEVDMPKDQGTSMREMVADQLRRKNSANLAKNLSRSGSSRGLSSKESSRKPECLEGLESEVFKPAVRLNKKQCTPLVPAAREESVGTADSSGSTKSSDPTTEKWLSTPLELRPPSDVERLPDAGVNNGTGSAKPESPLLTKTGSVEAGNFDIVSADSSNKTVAQAPAEFSNGLQTHKDGVSIASLGEAQITREVHGVSVSAACPPKCATRQIDDVKDSSVITPKAAFLEEDYPNSAPTQDLPDISPTAMWSFDHAAPDMCCNLSLDSADANMQRPSFEISPMSHLKVGPTDREISPTMPVVAAAMDAEISPTMPFVAEGVDGGSPGAPDGDTISATLPFIPAPDAARAADVDISPTMAFVHSPVPGLPRGNDISPTMPVAAPQFSCNASIEKLSEVSPTELVVSPVDQNSVRSAAEAKTSAAGVSNTSVSAGGRVHKRQRSASLMSEDSPSSSDDALSEPEPFGEEEGEEELTEGMTDADRKRWREEKAWLQHRRRAARRHGKAQKRGARVLAKRDQQGKAVSKQLTVAAGFSHEDQARFSATVTDDLGDFSRAADDDSNDFFGSLGAFQGRKRISLAAFK